MKFSANEDFALQLDAEDPLRRFRERFHLPLGPNGRPLIYFVGNSLGLMPKEARAAVAQELEDWAILGVDAHLKEKTPWYTYQEAVREGLAGLAGALSHEVIAMNSLTVNLHLMLATFYQPEGKRFRILMEEPAFPSDTYAVKSQIALRGLDPEEALLIIRPRPGEHTVRTDEVEAVLAEKGDEIAVVLLAGVNFFTGQLIDIHKLTTIAHHRGCLVGIDLAHAIGNVPLSLHDWEVDFAVWCSYKYLNAGPGAVAGAYLHEKHARNTKLPRLAGWFGNDPRTRFRLHLEPDFVPVASADAWQVSNPPIFSMAPLRASLSIFEEAGGMKKLRAKSIFLTGYLRFLLDDPSIHAFTVITPRDVNQHGAQLSLLAKQQAKAMFERLEANNVKCDFREPDVIRVAPAPLYNTFHEVWRFARVLRGFS